MSRLAGPTARVAGSSTCGFAGSFRRCPIPLGSAGWSTQLVQLQSSRLVDVRNGRLADPEREVAFEDAERLRDALQRGEERVFSVSLYLLLRAYSPRALDDLTQRVETTLDGMLAHSRIAILEQERAFRACLPIASM